MFLKHHADCLGLFIAMSSKSGPEWRDRVCLMQKLNGQLEDRGEQFLEFEKSKGLELCSAPLNGSFKFD